MIRPAPGASLRAALSVFILALCLMGHRASAQDDAPSLGTPGAEGAAPIALPGRARRIPTPTYIDFYTMGPGDDLFSAWGHAALCVTDALSPRGRCYNYGTTDFSDPIGLVWGFLRGDAQFWVSVGSEERMLALYKDPRIDRTVWRQRIDLTPAQAQAAAQRLAVDALPENRNYVYHHYKDNCATRLRDHIDVMLDGQLRAGAAEPYPDTYRDETLKGFAGFYPVTFLSELMVGSAVDGPITYWEAMFLPDVMRLELERKFGLTPEVIYTRTAGKPIPTGDPTSGKKTLAAMALVFTVLLFGAGRVGGRPFGAAVALTGLIYGLLGALTWGLYLSTAIQELTSSRALLFWLPLDWMMLGLRGLKLKRYALFRLGTCAVAALLWIFGVFAQPMLMPLLAVALPMAALYFSLAEPSADVFEGVTRDG